MEFQFENRFKMTEKMLVESTWANMKGLGIALAVATTVLAMAAGGNIISAIVGGGVDTKSLISMGCGAILLVFLCKVYELPRS